MRQSRKYTSEPFDGRLSIFDGSSVRNSPLMVRSPCTILLTLSPGGMAPLSANGTTDTGMAEFAPSVIRISSWALALPADSIIAASQPVRSIFTVVLWQLVFCVISVPDLTAGVAD